MSGVGTLPDDEAIPATVHLVGPDAIPMLRTAVEAAGGELVRARVGHVQYRPGSDVVVRFDASVRWHGGDLTAETLMAGATRHGAPAGTLPLVATVGSRNLEVGVWRWPFDPMLPSLADVVTPGRLAALLGRDERPDVEVVAFRPTERAVARANFPGGDECYVKVLPPARASAVIDRHRRLAEAGLPVPRVLAADPDAGWLAMTALRGDTMRLRLKDGRGALPTPADLVSLLDRLRAVDLGDVAPVATRTGDALAHAAVLAAVLPDQRPLLERLGRALAPAAERAAGRVGATVHGDLYEAQLVLDDDGAVIGLLDIDDVGPGDPIDDLATLVAHLRFREVLASDAVSRRRLSSYADALRRRYVAVADELGVGSGELDVVTAAVLVGLATGPFRLQRHGWRHDVRRILGRAERLLAGHDLEMRTVSSASQR